jgi:small subunit ribosomal protein S17
VSERGLSKNRVGFVVSNKMDKSVVVEVTRTVKHPFYGKFMRKRKRFMAHDENNACQIGDKIRIVETRPVSKNKRWRFAEKLA